eukprot:4812216-Pyramimonas_sp.AAC.1
MSLKSWMACHSGSAASGGGPIAAGLCPKGSGRTASGTAHSGLQYCLSISVAPLSGRARAGTQNPPT